MSEKTEALHEQEAAHIYRLRDEIMQQEIEMQRLRTQRDALLEALKPFATIGSGFDMDDVWRARAAIKKAEEA